MYELLGATPTKTTDNISHFISVPYIVALQFSDTFCFVVSFYLSIRPRPANKNFRVHVRVICRNVTDIIDKKLPST